LIWVLWVSWVLILHWLLYPDQRSWIQACCAADLAVLVHSLDICCCKSSKISYPFYQMLLQGA
jgi:hypothetical protein